MAIDKDKFVHSDLRKGTRAPRRRNSALVSDRYTKSEVTNEPGTHLPSWASEVGRRLEIIATRLGKDACVLSTEKSWKQLQRYFEGQEVPAAVVANIATASKASTDYILDGNIITSIDTEIERMIIDRKIRIIRSLIDSDDGDNNSGNLVRVIEHLLKRSEYLSNIGVVLIDRPKRLKSLEDYANPAAASSGEIDAAVLRKIWSYLGLQDILSTTPRPTTTIDADLLAAVHDGVSSAYKAENSRIYGKPLADEVARIYADLVAAYDSPEERQVGLKLALQQLRRHLQTPGTANTKQVS